MNPVYDHGLHGLVDILRKEPCRKRRGEEGGAREVGGSPPAARACGVPLISGNIGMMMIVVMDMICRGDQATPGGAETRVN